MAARLCSEPWRRARRVRCVPPTAQQVRAACKRHAPWLFLGQLLSLCITGTATTSQLLADGGVAVPTTQSFVNYALLMVVFVPWFLIKRRHARLDTPLWLYLIVSALDVEANFTVVKAYQYTTIASIVLLQSCLTPPFVMIFSRIVLKTRFRAAHIVGVLVALGGVALLVFTELQGGSATNVVLGDVMCALSSLFYAISNVLQEKVVRSYSAVEFLGMLGTFGVVINGVQLIVLERSEIAALDWSWEVGGLLAGFALCLFTLYALVPVLIRATTAAFYNLSLLTANVWSLFVGVLVFHTEARPLYIVAVVIVLLGIIVFSLQSPRQPPPAATVELSADAAAPGAGADSAVAVPGTAKDASDAGADDGGLDDDDAFDASDAAASETVALVGRGSGSSPAASLRVPSPLAATSLHVP